MLCSGESGEALSTKRRVIVPFTPTEHEVAAAQPGERLTGVDAPKYHVVAPYLPPAGAR
jgi:hypothetical protein